MFISQLEHCKFEPHELFYASSSFLLEEYVVVLDIDFPCSNKRNYNVSPSVSLPLLSYGVDDATCDVGPFDFEQPISIGPRKNKE